MLAAPRAVGTSAASARRRPLAPARAAGSCCPSGDHDGPYQPSVMPGTAGQVPLVRAPSASHHVDLEIAITVARERDRAPHRATRPAECSHPDVSVSRRTSAPVELPSRRSSASIRPGRWRRRRSAPPSGDQAGSPPPPVVSRPDIGPVGHGRSRCRSARPGPRRRRAAVHRATSSAPSPPAGPRGDLPDVGPVRRRRCTRRASRPGPTGTRCGSPSGGPCRAAVVALGRDRVAVAPSSGSLTTTCPEPSTNAPKRSRWPSGERCGRARRHR